MRVGPYLDNRGRFSNRENGNDSLSDHCHRMHVISKYTSSLL